MKKMISILLALALSLCLLCTGMADGVTGTYEGAAYGNNADVRVAVTLENGMITEVKVVEHAETPGLSDAPIERVPAQIVKYQTLAVDMVSGATNTSKAIIGAVEAALTAAGADVAAYSKAIEAEAGEAKVEELKTELLIIGGGGAGMAAAVAAANNGVDVLLIEKMSALGGATAISGGGMIVTGSNVQKRNNVTDTPEMMIEDILKHGDGMCNVPMLTMYANNLGEATNWLEEACGVQFGDVIFSAEYQTDRNYSFVGAAAGLHAAMTGALDASAAKYMLDTRATELIVEDGKVVGAVAQGLENTIYNIRAEAVLMATGGYGYAKDLLPDALKNVLYYGPKCSTGDGQKMLMALNAKFDMFEYGKIYPNGVEVSEGIAKSTIFANFNAFEMGGILIGKNGKRMVNEKDTNRALKDVLMAQDGQVNYLFMDAATFEYFTQALSRTGISTDELNAWLAANGTSTPVFAHADTVEEVAAIVGIDAAGLKETVERYNGFVEAGADADFGRPAAYLTTKIGEGPYYIVEQKPRFATTMGGVVLNENLQVMSEAGEVIPGLYAAGEVANLVQGTDSPGGANVGWALTSGYLAGNAISAALGK